MTSGNTLASLVFYLLYMTIVMFSYRLSWKKWNWFAILSYSLLLGFRGNGIDYFAYKIQFDFLSSLDYGLFDRRFYAATFNWATQNFEWVYLIIIKIIKYFNFTSIAFFTTIAFIQILFLDLFIQKFKKKRIKILLVFFFFTTLMFVESFNVMRQLIAILAYINIIPYLSERNYKKYFIFCGLLYFVHSSSIVLFPLYFFNKDFLKKESILFIIYFTAVVFSFFFKEKIGLLFNLIFTAFSFLDSRMVGYLDMSRETIVHKSEYSFKLTTFMFRTIGVSYLILNNRKFKEAYGNFGIFLFNMAFIGFVAQEFIFGINIQRLNYYFYYLSFIVFALIVDINLQNKTHSAMKMYTYMILAIYLLWFINSVYSGAADCAPYKLSNVL